MNSTIQHKEKECKGTYRVEHFVGCGEMVYNRKYGLCLQCYRKYLTSGTEEANKQLSKITITAKKTVKQEKKKAWNIKKTKWKQEIGVKAKPHQEPLQKSINKIVRLLDENLPCIARPTERMGRKDAGHIYGVLSHPSLRYHLWNIHGQGIKSNRDLGGETALMIEGVEIRYGKKRREYVESLKRNYPTLKLTTWEKKEALKKANVIIREIEKGEEYNRDDINNILQIYSKEDK